MIEEPTGDPTACELGEHLDVEGGICLLCGEWVIDGLIPEIDRGDV